MIVYIQLIYPNLIVYLILKINKSIVNMQLKGFSMWDKELKIKQVDNLLNEMKPRRKAKRPKKGWIQLLRSALGMSTRSLAERCGLSQSRISLIEKGEIEGSLTLNTLEKIAEGLDCELVYFLQPKQGRTLQELREQQAGKKRNSLISTLKFICHWNSNPHHQRSKNRHKTSLKATYYKNGLGISGMKNERNHQ